MTSNPQEITDPSPEDPAVPIPAKATKKRRSWRVPAICVVLLAALIGGGVAVYRAVRAPAFGVVVPGVLYRSSQLPPIALRRICRNNGIQTIINLRSPGDLTRDPKAVAEQQFAKEAGIQFINLPYNTLGPDATFERALKVIQDASNQPVLVHCAGGKERAGVIVAAYRITVQGWSAERALEEMKSYGFEAERQPRKVEFVRELGKKEGK